MPPDDKNYSHPHSGLATMRAHIESKIFDYITPSESIYEIAASSRTISANYRKMFFNRPVF
jgi:hypothetical protein